VISLAELEDEHENIHDFRRANGAPMVSDPDNPDKWQRYARPSGFGKDLDNEDALTNWKIFTAMSGVASSPALQAQVVVVKPDDKETKKALREDAIKAGKGSESADMGTALHAMTARWEDEEDDFDPPEQYLDDLNAYSETLADYGLVSEMTEYAIVHDQFRVAGTADRLYRLTKNLQLPDGGTMPAGTLVVGDLKTGKSLDFSLPGYCVQMALYADGQLYDVVDNVRLPTPEINREWTILVHLPVGKGECTLLWCNVGIGLWGAYLSTEVRKWRREWASGKDGHDAYEIAKPLDDEAVWIAEQFDAEVVVELTDVEALVVFVADRIKAVGAHEGARKRLLERWPKDVPTPKKGITDPLHVAQILTLLDQVEAQFSLPFPGDDPRVAKTAGKHKSEMNISNTLEPQDTATSTKDT
jgi:hypothetical protein